MVTKGYQKGVYEWVTLGISGGTGGLRASLVQKRYLAREEQSVIFRDYDMDQNRIAAGSG